MSGFKLLAVKTGKKGIMLRNFKADSEGSVEYDHFKNLKENTIYCFDQSYKFPQNDFKKIIRDSYLLNDLYTLKLSNNRVIKANISAIVGKNGSGKSALLELLFLINYNIGVTFKLLEDRNKKPYLIHETIDLELFYSVNEESHFILEFKDGKMFESNYTIKKDGSISLTSPKRKIDKNSVLTDFFYSIVINYSQYALNSLEIGEWIDPLFHKNDGYQTPIVLNPMRTNGNIDVNREKQLLSRRLQSNVLEPLLNNDKKNSLRNLANGKIASLLRVKYNSKYFKKIEEKRAPIFDKQHEEIIKNINTTFNIVYPKVDGIFSTFTNYIFQYVYYKLEKMVYHYPIFTEFRVFGTFENAIKSEKSYTLKNIEGLINEVFISNSHTVFKVKGAILHLKYYNKIYNYPNFNFDFPFDFGIDEMSDKIQDIAQLENKNFQVNTFMMSFPSFFDVEVIPEGVLEINNMSSGEKQKIFSLSSIAYHLINLNSVEEQKTQNGKVSRFKYINLVLDEIELYYHPDWQRTYINDLFEYLSKINPKNLNNIEGINIVFATHSPFILSDIPSSNILRLIDGVPQPFEEYGETFGANIHELLANDFFLNKATIGEFSKNQIQSVIDQLNKWRAQKNVINISDTERQFILKRIIIIGDSIVRNKLLDMYWQIFNYTYKSEKEINYMNRLIDSLTKQK